jgi:Fe(II)/alpha-ketoglutarate-dependent arginine beta-hydroxylase
MEAISITRSEMKRIDKLLNETCNLIDFPPSASDHSCLRQLSIYAYDLPKRIVESLVNFKYDESNEGVFGIRGFVIDDAAIAQTPPHWRNKEADECTKRESAFLLLCSAILGDAVGWSTQQDGNLVHNIVPIAGDEFKQVGSSTLTKLWWHTEEAFHSCRCDYLGLLCLRNHEGAATTYASVNSLKLSSKTRDILFGNYFSIYPDDSHLDAANNPAATHHGVMKLNEKPPKIPVLFGSYEQPYLCIDPYYMEQNLTEEEARQALQEIIGEIDRNLRSIQLKAGDLLLIDNYRTVHGREAFKADYGGRGRWLKRVNISRDLRKSRKLRKNFDSRIIETV